MSANLPTKTPDAPPDKPVENKFDRFRPEMPTIPGVSHASRKAGRGVSVTSAQRKFQIGGGIAVVVLLGATTFWTFKPKSRSAINSSSDSDVAEQSPSPQPNPVTAAHEGPTVAATLDELSKPWAAKKFIFVNPLTQENTNAIVIRLPGEDFWAFSLRAPFGQCDLEYVTDLSRLSTQYRFRASHPMVVSPCENTVFDPLKVGPLEGNTWARGEIVQGGSLRPPISIDVKVSGHSILADGIEQ